MKTKSTMVALATLLIGNHYFWLGRVVSSCLKVIMTRQRLSLLLVCAAVVLFMFACGDSATPKDRKRGAVVSEDSLAQLIVPTGAIPSGVTLTIADATATAPVIAMGNVYTIGPAGTQFSSPASLSITLPFDPADVWTDITGNDLAITRLDGDRWTTLESTYDPDTRTLTAEINHLSTFGYNLASHVLSSIVEDGDPAMVWADYWRGRVIAGVWEQEGRPTWTTLGRWTNTVGGLGEPGAIAFLHRRFEPSTFEVLWDAFPMVSVFYHETANPWPSHPRCGCGSITYGNLLSEPLWQQKNSDLSSKLGVIIRDRAYFLDFALETGQSVAGSFEVFCTGCDNPIAQGTRHLPLKRIGGEMAENLPADGPALSGEREWDVQAPVTLDMLNWDIEPDYEPDKWKLEYASMLRGRREFLVQTSRWEEIAQECAAGDRSGIVCRAAAQMLRNYEATVNRWIDDCERIQAALLHQTVTPLLTGTSVYDYAVLQGPVDFCWFTHKALLSFIPQMPAGDITIFRNRLPAEFKTLYTVRDLNRLFAP